MKLLAFLLLCLSSLVNLYPAFAAPPLEHFEAGHYRMEYRPELKGLARSLAQGLEEDHERIYAELGVSAEGQTTVTLLQDQDEMLDLARERSGGRPPEWAAGLAYPELHQIYIHAGQPIDQLRVTLRHEQSHVAFGEIDALRVPLWFKEGLAIEQSEGRSFERMWLLTESAAVKGALPFRELSRGFPVGRARAGLAYAQSVHFIGYFKKTYGLKGFQALIRELREGQGSFDDAILKVTGEPSSIIEQQWRKTVELWWGFLPGLFTKTGLWVLGGTLLFMAWRRRRNLTRQKYERMAREEQPILYDALKMKAQSAHQMQRPPTPPPGEIIFKYPPPSRMPSPGGGLCEPIEPQNPHQN